MAPQAQIIIAHKQHFLMNRAVHGMTRRAALAHRFMFPYKRTALLFVAIKAGLVDSMERCRRPRSHIRSVRTMARRAIHLSFKNGMMMRQRKFGLFIQVTGKARFGAFFRIDDIVFPSAGIDVKACRAVTHFTALNFDPLVWNADSRMRRLPEFFFFFRMAGTARFRTNVLRAFNHLHHER